MNRLLIITGLIVLTLGVAAAMLGNSRWARIGTRGALGVLCATAFSIALAGAATAQAPVATATARQPAAVREIADCGPDAYVNSDGQCIHDPNSSATAPAGATAQCEDGTYSFSTHQSGTCSGHGGVSRWL